jgi:mannobiose 2-epimerase
MHSILLRVHAHKCLLLTVIFCFVLLPTFTRAAELAALRAKVEKNLHQSIIPFWHPRCIDKEHGGYIINFNEQGSAPSEPGSKMIVTQARMVWYFSRLARAGFEKEKNLAAAEHGFKFLTEKMWDQKNGGFIWEVDATGKNALHPKKHLYGQSFALYAISEYYLASGKTEALRFADRFFQVLEDKSYDRTHGGYIEFFNADWTQPADTESSYMGVPANVKLMNTHLHLMEALTTYYRACKSAAAKQRLIELITIQTSTVVRKDLGACTDKFARDWTPLLEGDWARVSYGHDIENIWLIMDACQAAGLPNGPFMDLHRSLWDYSIKYGYDKENGGFYDSGRFRAPADRKAKVWWAQAEGIVAALYLYAHSGNQDYLKVFEQTLDYVNGKMTDWKNGEWFEEISPEGRVKTGKAHAWKAGYHNGRAMIECLELLKKLQTK